MKYLLFALLFMWAGAVQAQQPIITSETTVNSDILQQWLNSGDPRLIAWAADFACRTNDAKIVAEMPELLEHWTLPQVMGEGNSQAEQRRAVAAVLDALIQENARVPIPAVAAVAEYFPAQAAILIGRLPLSEARPTLEHWTYGESGTWARRTLARIASMMLAKDPGSSRVFWNGTYVGFVASIVAASEEELQIRVVSVNTQEKATGGGACGDSFGRELSPGWPQVYIYYLVENDPRASAPIVIDLDGDRIVSRRIEENRPGGSCYGVEHPDSSTRHRLIAYWLGVKEKNMSWQPTESYTIIWTDKAAYQRLLGKIIEAHREKLQATAEMLRQRGLLTETEAATMAPTLIVKIQCDIKPCPL